MVLPSLVEAGSPAVWVLLLMMARPGVLPGDTVGPGPLEMLVRMILEDVSVAIAALGLPISIVTAVGAVRWDWQCFGEVVV